MARPSFVVLALSALLSAAPAAAAPPSIQDAERHVDLYGASLSNDVKNQLKQLAATRTKQGVAMVQTASALMLDAQMTGMQNRIWELRDGGKGGFWIKGGGSKFRGDTSDALAFDERVKYGSVGGDYGWDLGAGTLYLGAYIGMGQGDIDTDVGLSGTVKNEFIGSYLTYFEENAWYVDLSTRVGKMKFDFDVDLPKLSKNYKADASHDSFSGSLETGYHFALDKGWFVEPQAQLLYEYIGQSSLLGRLGVRAGKDFSVSGTKLSPFMTLSYLAQLSNDDSVSYGGSSYKAALPGNRWQTGLGLALESGRHRAAADLRYGHGSDLAHEITVAIGYSYRF